MKLLITGGAGYIGSHMARHSSECGHEVVILDNFSTGHAWAVKEFEVLNVDLLDKKRLSKLLKGRYFDGVFHFAAKSIVSESIKNPHLYYENNIVGTLNLVNEMLNNNINNFVFSSSAAIYGNPTTNIIDESHKKNPITPYGKSKLIVEKILHDLSLLRNLNVICFRYFNAAGAHESSLIGEEHHPETHLIPSILKSANSGDIFKVFGNDYSTKDGTCIRDYVHVMDLVDAHLLGLKKIIDNSGFYNFNLGNGKGFSVLEVIDTCSKVLGKKIKYNFHKKRIGDPAILVADSSRAVKEIGWNPKFGCLEKIIQDAWNWHNKDNINIS